MIYLIECKSGIEFDLIAKIGAAKNPNDRLKTLQVGNPFKLNLLYKFNYKYSFELEKKLHLYFKSYLYRGEWFYFKVDCVKEFVLYFNTVCLDLKAELDHQRFKKPGLSAFSRKSLLDTRIDRHHFI